jgi:UDP-glucuronate decarboxylase
MNELADLIVDLTNSSSRVVRLPLPQDDPRQRRPDISRARRELQWAPQVGLKKGLKLTIAYFDKLLRDENVRAFVTT